MTHTAARFRNTGGRVSRRLRTLRLGDLHDNELRPFLQFLADTIKFQDGATRFRALWEKEPQQAALRQRYGGYVSDLVALRALHNKAGSASGARAACTAGTHEH